MAGSTLDPDNIPAKRRPHTQKGHDVASLGPSDTSDSGSDMKGAVGDRDMDDTTDSRGTGEHLTAGNDPRSRPNEDRDADRVVGEGEAGLGRGLDEAEEARKKPERKR